MAERRIAQVFVCSLLFILLSAIVLALGDCNCETDSVCGSGYYCRESGGAICTPPSADPDKLGLCTECPSAGTLCTAEAALDCGFVRSSGYCCPPGSSWGGSSCVPPPELESCSSDADCPEPNPKCCGTPGSRSCKQCCTADDCGGCDSWYCKNGGQQIWHWWADRECNNGICGCSAGTDEYSGTTCAGTESNRCISGSCQSRCADGIDNDADGQSDCRDDNPTDECGCCGTGIVCTLDSHCCTGSYCSSGRCCPSGTIWNGSLCNGNPFGWHDSNSCDTIIGWTCDRSNFALANDVQIYKEGNVLVASGIANAAGEAAIGAQCGGYTDHRFFITAPNSIRDNVAHTLTVYGINLPGTPGINIPLSGTPKPYGPCCSSQQGQPCNFNVCGASGGTMQCNGQCSGPVPPIPTGGECVPGTLGCSGSITRICDASCKWVSSEDCASYENPPTYYCNAGKYWQVRWGCFNGACTDASAADTHSGTNLDSDAWDAECGDKNATHDCDYGAPVSGINLSSRVIENTAEKCMNGLDDDCDGPIDCFDNDCVLTPSCYGTVKGHIYDGEKIGLGWTIPQATVKGSPPGVPESNERTVTSDLFGYYEIPDAYPGTYHLIARKEGYKDSIVQVQIPPNAEVVQDFILYQGVTCKPDCTDQNNYCSAGCDGLTFNSTDGMGNTITDKCTLANPSCAGKPKGYKVNYLSGGINYEVTCCEGPARSYPSLKPTVSGNVKRAYDHVTPVRINGRIYLMHILVWQ